MAHDITPQLTGGLDEEALAAGRRLFCGPVTFVRGAPTVGFLPEASLPEIAFAGRSNVGKSSLINALTGRKTLARTSNTPGRTQEINFFDLGSRLLLVDLPGYGFAKVPLEKVTVWTDTIKRYLRGRVPLRRALVLVDARHGLKANDLEIMEMLDQAAVSYQIVLTKADKVRSDELEQRRSATGRALAKHPAAHPEVAVTSAELRAALAQLGEAPAPA